MTRQAAVVTLLVMSSLLSLCVVGLAIYKLIAESDMMYLSLLSGTTSVWTTLAIAFIRANLMSGSQVEADQAV